MQTNIHYAVVVILLLLLSVFFVSLLLYSNNQSSPSADDIAAVRSEYFAPLETMSIGGVMVEASVATTPEERRTGLSNTPFLPPGVVKLFVFPESDYWGIWMPDMNYPIDILWLNESASIIHIETAVEPDTYPETFVPYQPALYVIETEAGFVATHNIALGNQVDLPAGL